MGPCNVSQFDQVVWQQSFYRSLDLKGKTEENENALACATACQDEIDTVILRDERFDPALFQKCLSTHHKDKVIAVAKKIFEESLPELKEAKDFFVGFTGSDGREEKLSPHSSPVEIVVGFKAKDGLRSGVLEKVQKLISAHPHLFYKDIEVKCMDTDALMTFQGVKDERPFPTRALDARFLVGNDHLFIDYRKAFFRELQEAKNSKALKAFKTSAVLPTYRVFKNAVEGVNKNEVDLSTGKVAYDGERIKGVKYTYLRSMQYKLGMYVFSLIQKKKLGEDEFLQMPFTTVERIQWLADKNLIKATAAEIKSYQNAYITSLVWFSISQKRFEVFGEREIALPPGELKAVAEVIAQCCEKLAA